VAVILVGEPAVRPRTALGRVARLNLLNRHTLLGRFVGYILEQATERPYVVPLRVRKSLSNVCQVFKHDYVTVVFDRFRDDFVGDGVDVLFAPGVFASRVEAGRCARPACRAVASLHVASRTHGTSGRSRPPARTCQLRRQRDC